jgi:hypothetical protein
METTFGQIQRGGQFVDERGIAYVKHDSGDGVWGFALGMIGPTQSCRAFHHLHPVTAA